MEKSFKSARFGEVKLDLGFDFGNDGIGPYEYWGQRCNDRGKPTVEDIHIESIEPDTPKARAEAEGWIQDNWDEVVADALEDRAERKRYGNE